jgi:hypothetical protein
MVKNQRSCCGIKAQCILSQVFNDECDRAFGRFDATDIVLPRRTARLFHRTTLQLPKIFVGLFRHDQPITNSSIMRPDAGNLSLNKRCGLLTSTDFPGGEEIMDPVKAEITRCNHPSRYFRSGLGAQPDRPLRSAAHG